MVNPDSQDDEEKPLDPAMARVQARLQRLMLIAGLTLGVGILAVFLAIIYRITSADDRAPVVADAPATVVEAEAETAPANTADVESEPETVAAPATTESSAAEPVATLPPVAVLPPPEAEAGSTAPGTAAAMLAVEASIPADSRLVASTVAGGRIVLTYDHFGGTIVLVVDPDTLQVVGRLDLKHE